MLAGFYHLRDLYIFPECWNLICHETVDHSFFSQGIHTHLIWAIRQIDIEPLAGEPNKQPCFTATWSSLSLKAREVTLFLPLVSHTRLGWNETCDEVQLWLTFVSYRLYKYTQRGQIRSSWDKDVTETGGNRVLTQFLCLFIHTVCVWAKFVWKYSGSVTQQLVELFSLKRRQDYFFFVLYNIWLWKTDP